MKFYQFQLTPHQGSEYPAVIGIAADRMEFIEDNQRGWEYVLYRESEEVGKIGASWVIGWWIRQERQW